MWIILLLGFTLGLHSADDKQGDNLLKCNRNANTTTNLAVWPLTFLHKLQGQSYNVAHVVYMSSFKRAPLVDVWNWSQETFQDFIIEIYCCQCIFTHGVIDKKSFRVLLLIKSWNLNKLVLRFLRWFEFIRKALFTQTYHSWLNLFPLIYTGFVGTFF